MQYQKIGARVIAKDSGDWFQVFRINKGSADGVQVDANVMAGGGLVGIVTDVGAHYATVRSIIDDVSRVSGMAQQSGDTCIVSGDLTLFGEGRLRLSNIAENGRSERRRPHCDLQHQFQISSRNPDRLRGRYHHRPESRLTKSGYLIPAAHFDSLQEVLVITTHERGRGTAG